MKFSSQGSRVCSEKNGDRKAVFSLLFATALLSSSIAQAACPLTPADRGTVKWNPGHYIMIGSSDGSVTRLAEILGVYKNIPAVKGVQKTYFWSDIEPLPGKYNFSEIDKDIVTLSAAGKKLAVVIGYKYQDSDSRSSLPNHVLQQAAVKIDGTSVLPYFDLTQQISQHTDGQNANFGHPGTLLKFNNLLNALSKKYDSNPNFASLSFIETPPGVNLTAAAMDIYLNGIIAVQKRAGCTFKHTPVFQDLNYPRGTLAAFTSNMKAYGIGLSGPDVYIDSMNRPDTGLGYDATSKNPGVYHYYPPMSEVVPIGIGVHRANFKYAMGEDRFPAPGTPHNLPEAQSVGKIYDLAASQLTPNYMFWHVYGSWDPYGNALEDRLRSPAGLPLNTACPPVYGKKCNAP